MEVPLFVTFHFINAYEEKDEDGRVSAVIADCCEHSADTTILDKLRLENLRSFNGEDVLPDARYNYTNLTKAFNFVVDSTFKPSALFYKV